MEKIKKKQQLNLDWDNIPVFNPNPIKFVILNLIGLGLNTGILYLLVDMVGFNKLIALVITTGIVMIINYIVNKLWVFKEK